MAKLVDDNLTSTLKKKKTRNLTMNATDFMVDKPHQAVTDKKMIQG